MEQIVEYSSVKTITDITKKFANIPIHAVVNDQGRVQFTIANFKGFKALISSLIADYENEENIVVNENNVVIYEREASQIKKLADQVKKDAQAFVDEFSVELLGKTRGKNKVKGQVQIIGEELMNAYDKIHKKTKEFRELSREAKEEVIEAETTVVENTHMYAVKVPTEKKELFEKFLNENNLEYQQY